jgi:hypothetical protein
MKLVIASEGLVAVSGLLSHPSRLLAGLYIVFRDTTLPAQEPEYASQALQTGLVPIGYAISILIEVVDGEAGKDHSVQMFFRLAGQEGS